MRLLILPLFACVFTFSYGQEDTLFLVEHEETGDLAYLNSVGDTIIPAGTFEMCFTPVFTNFAIVMKEDDSGWRCVAINRQMEELYEVYWFDNGPDYIEDGLFRIVKEDKIGYANEAGEIVIEPQFACADPFENGKARVTYECTHERDGEYETSVSTTWFNINKKGKKVK